MILGVKVTPQASKNEILRWEKNLLVIKIQGIPEKEKVNENLINFLAKKLKIAKSDIKILAGQTSHLKKVDIQGISLQQLKKLTEIS